MAFRPINLIKFESNQNSILTTLGAQLSGPQIFSYKTTEDTSAVVSAGTYFAQNNPNPPQAALLEQQMRVGDLIWCSCSDNNVLMQVTVASPTNTTSIFDVGSPPSHVIKYAGQPTTAGGAAAEVISVPGVLATDYAFVQMVDDGTNNTTVLNAVCTADTLTVTFSADPGADAIINYQVIRAAV